MGAVADAVGGFFEAVGDAVGAVIEGAGKIVETVVTEVVQPVVKAVGKTIQAALDDPLGTIAKIGVAIVAPELVPAFNFGYNLANGASLEKALLNTGLNMVGAEIGVGIGNELSNTLDLSCTASDILTSGAKGAAASVLKGQNPLCGAVGSIANNLVNSGANSLYKCLSNSSNTGLPVSTSAASDDCAKGCASTTQLGGLPTITNNNTQVGKNQDCTVTVTGNANKDACSVDNLTRSLTPTGSAATTDTGATAGTGALDTVNVTGKLEKCTDLVCTPNTNVTGGLPTCTNETITNPTLPTVTVTGKKEACCITCTNTPTVTTLPTVTVTGKKEACCITCTNTPTVTTLPTVTVTGKKEACCITCTNTPTVTTLPTVTVTGKKDPCCIDCCCDCCDKDTKVTIPKVTIPKVKIPKVKIPKVKSVQTAGTLGSLGCGAIPWLDTRDSLLKNQIAFDKPTQAKADQSKLQDIYASMHPELAKEMQNRYGGVPQINLMPFGENTGGLAHGGSFASGGKNEASSCAASCSLSYCYNQDPQYMPKFIADGPDFLVNSASSKRQPVAHKQLTQLAQRISNMGNMGGLAAGGLPKKYHDAMPDNHNPEFVTGMTGYYACGGGTGQSDDIPAMLHDGDYVMDADVVAALGDGSSKAGREVLDGFRNQIPHRETAKGQPVPAKIADGEYVFPAGFVSAIGGGDNKAGAKILDGLREKLRAHKRSAPTSKIPPKAKSPLDYIKQTKG